jgi:hypothetical protein
MAKQPKMTLESRVYKVLDERESPRDDLERWEGEGGSSRPRYAFRRGQPVFSRFAVARRASYDSPVRIATEAMMARHGDTS